MPIIPAEVPGDGAGVISRALRPLSRKPEAIAVQMASGRDEEGSLTFDFAVPHPVYLAGLDAVFAGDLLGSARQDGWRYLLLRGDEAVGSATVEWDDDAKNLAFSHITQGPFASSTLQGMLRADRLSQVADHDFEPRLLDVPALRLRTLWLHGEDRDVLIPLEPAPPQVEAYRAYSQDELVEAVREPAASLRRSADQPFI